MGTRVRRVHASPIEFDIRTFVVIVVSMQRCHIDCIKKDGINDLNLCFMPATALTAQGMACEGARRGIIPGLKLTKK